MRLIDADALLEKFNRKADIWTALTDEDTASDFAFYCKLADAVEEMPTINDWISVKDRPPEEKINPYTQDYQEVICLFSTRFGNDVRVYKFGRGHFWNGPCEIDKYITHWMPLPEPPKEDAP